MPRTPKAYFIYFFSIFILLYDSCLIDSSFFMCTKLMQIYQKRTPTFLAEISTIVAIMVLLVGEKEKACGISNQIQCFYWAVLLVGGVQLLMKLVIFSILYWQNREMANTFNTLALFISAGLHLALWIYSITLLGNQELRICGARNHFFLKCYVFGYGAMILGGIVLFIILGLSAVGVTIATLKRARKQGEDEIEI